MIRGLFEDYLIPIAVAVALVIMAVVALLATLNWAYSRAVHSDERVQVCYELRLMDGSSTPGCFELSPAEVDMLRIEGVQGVPTLTSGFRNLRGGVIDFGPIKEPSKGEKK